MPVSRARKEELLETYVELLGKCQGVILTENKGLSVAGLSSLRNKLRAQNGRYHVAKNTITRKALKEVGMAVPSDEALSGPIVLGIANDSLPELAKAILEFAKTNDKLVVRGGVMGNRVLSLKDVEAIAELPPLPIVRGQLLGLISTPASRLVGVVAGGVRQLVNVTKAYADKEQA